MRTVWRNAAQMCFMLGCALVAFAVVNTLWGMMKERGREARLRVRHETTLKYLNVRQDDASVCVCHLVVKYTRVSE